MNVTIKFFSTLFFLCFVVVGLEAQETILDKEVYDVVDKLPRLKKAGKDIGQHFRKQIDFDSAYKLQGIEGDVWLSFVVTSKGVVEQAEVEKGIDEKLDAEVLAMLKDSGPWKPGTVNRQAVNTRMRIPVRFALTNDERQMATQIRSLNAMGKQPLFVLDNKIVDGLMEIADYNVASIRIIKGEKAIRLYGTQAADGVVVITSKRGTPPIY
ncbi:MULTISPECIES: TonB family protein [unclassified Carboxylicivirga]|uniref:energy transducer TonB n=1 Tax=Carboxylicivirga TaxID=1628153 RepID=UPI003D34E709